MMVMHIILDTDIGGDSDDLFAVLMAAGSPELSLDLLVTNDEHKDGRAQFTARLLSLMGKGSDIPVAAGIDLGNTKYFLVGDQIRGFHADVSHDFLGMIKAVVEKNHITHYVCIGPQSNLAAFIEAYPNLRDKVRILIMGGAINYRKPGEAQHNVRYDVAAARKVFYSDWDKRFVISDVTFRKEIEITPQSDFYKRLKRRSSTEWYLSYALESVDSYFTTKRPESCMHDPLALSCLIDENIIKFKTENISMDEKGVMKIDPGGQSAVVSESADYSRFWRLFEKIVLG